MPRPWVPLQSGRQHVVGHWRRSVAPHRAASLWQPSRSARQVRLHHLVRALDDADLGQAQDAHRLIPALGFFQLADALAALHDVACLYAAAADAKTFIEGHVLSVVSSPWSVVSH